MIFTPHQIKSPFDKYIQSIFHFKGYVPEHSIERVVPTGHLFIIFELDNFKRQTFDNVTLQPNATYTKVWISGMHQHHINISTHQQSEMFVIQFKPIGAHPFLHIPIEELNEKIIPAEIVFGESVLTLRHQILNEITPEDKFKLAEHWLAQQFDNSKVPPSHFYEVFEKLEKEPVSNYDKIIQDYPNTQKHLINQFKKYAGLKPKYFQRILRFNEILAQIHEKKSIEWAQIAYQCGYADQSHFIKEFKHFSGFNPQEFIGKNFHNTEPNFFPINPKG